MAKKFTYEEFVIAWQAATSIKELMEKFDCHKHTIETTAITLRKAGVELKRFRAARKGKPDTEALNKLIATLGPPANAADTEDEEEEEAQATA